MVKTDYETDVAIATDGNKVRRVIGKVRKYAVEKTSKFAKYPITGEYGSFSN